MRQKDHKYMNPTLDIFAIFMAHIPMFSQNYGKSLLKHLSI